MAVAVLACVLTLGLFAERPERPDAFDAEQYLAAAYHLAHHGVFSESRLSEAPPPGMGREPGYALLLAGLMTLDGSFASFEPGCFAAERDCRGLYTVPQWANVGFLAAAGVLVFLAARALFGSLAAAFAAGGHIWLNHQAHDGLFYLVSDYFAVFLLALGALAVVWAWRRPSLLAWVGVGAALAALTLTKAVYLYYALPLGLCLVPVALWQARTRRRLLLSLAAAALTYAGAVGGWMARNHEVGGVFALTQTRGGIALSTREVLNHMSPAQYGAAFVYWTRGFGDNLARRLYPEAVWGPFELGNPEGFYLRGQLGYGTRVETLMRERGLARRDAEAEIDRQLRAALLSDLPVYAATTLPVFYRGIWIDEFIVVSLPGLIWLALWALRRRRWDVILVAAPGAFSLVFYALFSLNIPRYQLTALPALAVATGFLAWRLQAWWLARRGAEPSP